MSVRERLEQQQIAARYAARSAPGPSPEQIDSERQARLAQNARKIREDRVNQMLVEMSDDEREVVFDIIGRERPECLGNADVVQTTLQRVRVDGTNTLGAIMRGVDDTDRAAVWGILQQEGNAESRLGLDNGAGCRAALRRVQDDRYFN
jgi:hypothetical protein